MSMVDTPQLRRINITECPDGQTLTAKEISDITHRDYKKIRKAIKHSEIAFKLGKRYFVPALLVFDFLLENNLDEDSSDKEEA